MITSHRLRLLAGSGAALALAACSGADTAPIAQETQTTQSPATPSASEAAPEPAAVTTELPAPTATPDPAETPEPASAPSPSPTPSPVPSTATTPAPRLQQVAATSEPPKAFVRCAVCHNAAKGAPDKLGPNLYGTFGKPFGEGGFAYSDALKSSGLVMDEATLDQWMENPRKLVPGNRMSFPGLRDAEKRQEIIAYLKQQR